MAERGPEVASSRFLASAGALLAAALLLAAQSLEVPGLYYDEAVQARPAKEFVNGIVYGSTFPGSSTTSIWGRPFPLMTQPYMGALKSQALIPSIWLFGSETLPLRLTTLIWALIGVALIGSFARRAFGEATALVAILLLAFDPSLLLLARHDWGSFALSLLLRGAALWCCWRWWETRRLQFLLVGFLALGLGVYNKVDFAVFLAGTVLGVAACGAAPLIRVIREKPVVIATAALGFILGLAPMLPNLPSVIAARGAFATPNESAEKLRTLWTLLDGSYFHRLMEVGGLFDRMQQADPGPSHLLGFAFVLAVAIAVAMLSNRRLRSGDAFRGGAFVVVAAIGAVLALLALPGGVRIHHALNIYPYPHLVIAWLVGCLAARAKAAQLTGALAVCAIAVSGVIVFAQTLELSDRTGGRGRWSDSINAFARELDSRPQSVVVSLDWGFHENLGFLTEGPRLIDAYPLIAAAVKRRGFWELSGGANHIYVLHSGEYDLFGYGAPFLRAIGTLEAKDVDVRRHRDGEGELAFVSVQIAHGHRVSLRAGEFQVRLHRTANAR